MSDSRTATISADRLRRRPARDYELPAPGTDRWTPRRKAAVVAAVNDGALTVDEACTRYRMSLEEFSAWDRALHNFGFIGRG
jgi:hypothetical protein